MDLEKWQSQLRKGTIEYGLLQLVASRKSVYGLEIIEGLSNHGLVISEGTLYPILNRLTKEKVLAPKWQTENVSGHPRKYYQLTSLGKKILNDMDEQWQQLNDCFASLKKES